MNRKRSRRKWTAHDLTPDFRESMMLSHNRYQQAKQGVARWFDQERAKLDEQRRKYLAEIEAEFEVERRAIVDLCRQGQEAEA